jgi:tRNA (Thr-GGU) A37 N-methylase
MIELHPIGIIRSVLRRLEDAPPQGSEGAPDACLEIEPTLARALSGIRPGDELDVRRWSCR